MTGTRLKSQKAVFNAKYFTIYESKVVYPTGKEAIHHNVVRSPSVSVFPLTPKHEIYLIRQYRYTLNKETLEAVAGMVEGETPLATAKRELKEEAGITASQWELLTKIDVAASIISLTSSLFLARDLEVAKQQLEESEEIKLVKMPLKEAVEKVMIGEITTTGTIIGIMMLDKLKRERKL